MITPVFIAHRDGVALFAREDIACRYCERRDTHAHLVDISDLSAAEILAMDEASLTEALIDYCAQWKCSLGQAIRELYDERREDEERGRDERGRRVA